MKDYFKHTTVSGVTIAEKDIDNAGGFNFNQAGVATEMVTFKNPDGLYEFFSGYGNTAS